MAKKQWWKIVKDDSGHDYVIPADKSEKWYSYDWDGNDWEPPHWATRVEGGVQFTEWREHYD